MKTFIFAFPNAILFQNIFFNSGTCYNPRHHIIIPSVLLPKNCAGETMPLDLWGLVRHELHADAVCRDPLYLDCFRVAPLSKSTLAQRCAVAGVLCGFASRSPFSSIRQAARLRGRSGPSKDSAVVTLVNICVYWRFAWPAQKIRKKAQVHVAFLVAGAARRNGSGGQRRKTTTQWARRKAAALRWPRQRPRCCHLGLAVWSAVTRVRPFSMGLPTND